MSNTELEATCKEILALKGVIGVVFYNRNGEIVIFKSNVEPEHWLIPRERHEIERKTLVGGEMIYEIAGETFKYFGKLEAMAFLHEKRNSFLISVNDLFLGITTKKTADVSIIKKVKKIIKKHTRW